MYFPRIFVYYGFMVFPQRIRIHCGGPRRKTNVADDVTDVSLRERENRHINPLHKRKADMRSSSTEGSGIENENYTNSSKECGQYAIYQQH